MLKLADQNTTLSGSAEGVANPAPRRWPSAIFFLLCLGVAALLAALDADVRLTVLRAASRVQTAEKPSAELQVGQHTTILHAPAIDARWWVIHAEAALRQGAWRIRDTKLDNAPEGREVHWSSGPIWTLRAIAAGIAAFTGQPILQTIPEAALWFGPVTFALGAVLLSILMGMTFGWRPAGLLILVLATALPVCGNFRVGEPDHHGVVLFFLLGSVLCIAAGGAGAVMLGARQRTRRYFALAGLLGAAAMWVSAATTISVLAGCGLGALVAAALLR